MQRQFTLSCIGILTACAALLVLYYSVALRGAMQPGTSATMFVFGGAMLAGITGIAAMLNRKRSGGEKKPITQRRSVSAARSLRSTRHASF